MEKVRIEKLNGRDIFSVIEDGLNSFGLPQRLKSCQRVFGMEGKPQAGTPAKHAAGLLKGKDGPVDRRR